MDKTPFSGSIKRGDMQISFEGPKEFVTEMMTRFVDGEEWKRKNGSEAQRNTDPTNSPQTTPTTRIRELIALKQPRGHHEIIAVLAFGLTESGKKVFGEDDVRGAYIDGAVRPPKFVAQGLRDAKNKYEYLESGGKRGQYKLSELGDRLVRFDLPRVGAKSS